MASALATAFHLQLKAPSRGLNYRSRISRSGLVSEGFFRRRHWHHRATRVLLVMASNNSGSVDADAQRALKSNAPGDGYVGLFVRMLGIDHDPLDREQAIMALWKYSQGGKHCIDLIMKFPGCVNLTVNLLKSDSISTCEAAAGLLRAISSVNIYRDAVVESGVIEEIICLLNKSALMSEVKEQCLCVLWNLSVDETLRGKVANMDLLPAILKFLSDEEEKVKEAAGGILANLALSDSFHSIMVEASAIQKLAELLKSRDGSQVSRKEAKNVLLELAKDKYYRILIIEEGLILVPFIGEAAYKSFKPASHSWPSLPDGTAIERRPSTPSRYGAAELLLGLNIRDKNIDLEEVKANAIVGRTQQQFLARIGAIEKEERKRPPTESYSNQLYTLLPWVDGIARLVLILGLDDVGAITKAAYSIADASINEHLRMSFKEAGAVKDLVQLLSHDNEAVRVAVAYAVEKLSFSDKVCQTIEAEGVMYPLFNILKNRDTSPNLLEKTLGILSRILDPGKEMKTKFHVDHVNGSEETINATKKHSEGIAGLVVATDETSVLQPVAREEVIDSSAISRLVELLKTPSPNFQKMVASILECLATREAYIKMIAAAGVESGLDAVFQQRHLDGILADLDSKPEMTALEAEEVGLAISATSSLLTKLLSFEQFHGNINITHFIFVLRKILKSDIPLHFKESVAACLVKLESLSSSHVAHDSPINMEVTLYETIPRLIHQIRTSLSPEVLEAAVTQLHDIICTGVVDYTRAVAAQGGIFLLVKLTEEGSGRTLEASLAILYNLSMDSENHSAIISAGAVPTLKRIVRSEMPQWRQALNLLRTLPT